MLIYVVELVIILMLHILEYIVPDKVQSMNVKVINLMSRVNQKKFLVQNESCEYKCGLTENICNSKQK